MPERWHRNNLDVKATVYKYFSKIQSLFTGICKNAQDLLRGSLHRIEIYETEG